MILPCTYSAGLVCLPACTRCRLFLLPHLALKCSVTISWHMSAVQLYCTDLSARYLGVTCIPTYLTDGMFCCSSCRLFGASALSASFQQCSLCLHRAEQACPPYGSICCHSANKRNGSLLPNSPRSKHGHSWLQSSSERSCTGLTVKRCPTGCGPLVVG